MSDSRAAFSFGWGVGVVSLVALLLVIWKAVNPADDLRKSLARSSSVTISAPDGYITSPLRDEDLAPLLSACQVQEVIGGVTASRDRSQVMVCFERRLGEKFWRHEAFYLGRDTWYFEPQQQIARIGPGFHRAVMRQLYASRELDRRQSDEPTSGSRSERESPANPDSVSGGN